MRSITIIGKPIAVGRAVLRKNHRSALFYHDGERTRLTGRAALVGGRWVHQKLAKGKYHTRASVPRSCAVTFAAAAGRILLW